MGKKWNWQGQVIRFTVFFAALFFGVAAVSYPLTAHFYA
jgi:hypothetical protein